MGHVPMSGSKKCDEATQRAMLQTAALRCVELKEKFSALAG